MEIEIFTLADFAQDNSSKLTIVGTFDSIQSKQFPCIHPACAIAMRLRFSEKETGDHDFKLKLNDTAGKELFPAITGNIKVMVPASNQYSAINIVVNLNQLKFEKEGKYSFELYIDDDWATGLTLNLIKLH
ncbi:MAG: hypothetical protein JJE22_07415 [Bacteroidia bacterium]|nr:hypothetical protein [Bacteroidia bacterium]